MKVSIPKEEIGKIIGAYRCTEKEAAKAFLSAQEKAGETFNAAIV